MKMKDRPGWAESRVKALAAIAARTDGLAIDVQELTRRGLTAVEIARRMGMSERSVVRLRHREVSWAGQ